MGALVALCTEKKCQLGFLVAVDESYKVAVCNDSSCFFAHPTRPVSSYFNHVRTISFEDIFKKKFILYTLNQLNGYRCFRNVAPTTTPDCIVSKFDGKFNCSPDGCDEFIYDCYKNDALYRIRLDNFPTSLIGITPSSRKKRKNRGFRNRLMFRYNIDEFQKNVKFMNYDFHNSIPVPDGHFAVPYSSDIASF